jgi:hypothetical protein
MPGGRAVVVCEMEADNVRVKQRCVEFLNAERIVLIEIH